jgi:hypothetical protein
MQKGEKGSILVDPTYANCPPVHTHEAVHALWDRAGLDGERGVLAESLYKQIPNRDVTALKRGYPGQSNARIADEHAAYTLGSNFEDHQKYTQQVKNALDIADPNLAEMFTKLDNFQRSYNERNRSSARK